MSLTSPPSLDDYDKCDDTDDYDVLLNGPSAHRVDRGGCRDHHPRTPAPPPSAAHAALRNNTDRRRGAKLMSCSSLLSQRGRATGKGRSTTRPRNGIAGILHTNRPSVGTTGTIELHLCLRPREIRPQKYQGGAYIIQHVSR